MHACSMHACINVYIFPSTEFNFPSTMCLLSTIYTRVYPPALVPIVTRQDDFSDFRKTGQNFSTQKLVYFSQILLIPTFLNACLSTRIGLNGRNFNFGLFEQRVKSPKYFLFPLQRCYFSLLLSIHPHWFEWSQDDSFECRKKGSNFRITDFFSPLTSMFSTLWIVVCLYPFAVDLNDWE